MYSAIDETDPSYSQQLHNESLDQHPSSRPKGDNTRKGPERAQWAPPSERKPFNEFGAVVDPAQFEYDPSST